MYDLFQAREYEVSGQKKTAFHTVGRAFESKNKDGFDCIFNVLPMPAADGTARVMGRTSKPRDGTDHTPQSVDAALQGDNVPF